MARPLRTVLVGLQYHLTQRGNYRQQVFFCEGDYQTYLELLWQYAVRYGLEILAYCLMPNHVHYVAIPRTEIACARTFGIGHMCYARYRHRATRCVGHLWQGRSFAAPLDELFCARAFRYVEMNPVRAGLVSRPEDWSWSSAACHLRGDRLPGATLPSDPALSTWREFLGQDESPGTLECLRIATHTGRPCSDAAFLAELEQRFDHSFTPHNPRATANSESERRRKISDVNNV